MRAIAVPDASASTQPRAPQPQTRAVGFDDDVADVAGVAVGAVEQAAVERRCRRRRPSTRPSRCSCARPRPRRSSPRRARAPWRRCRSTPGSPRVLGEPGAQREVAPRRDVERRDGFAAARHRTAASDADRAGGAGPRRRGRRSPPSACANSVVGVGRMRRRHDAPIASTCPSASTMPTASFVPPMSMATTVRVMRPASRFDAQRQRRRCRRARGAGRTGRRRACRTARRAGRPRTRAPAPRARRARRRGCGRAARSGRRCSRRSARRGRARVVAVRYSRTIVPSGAPFTSSRNRVVPSGATSRGGGCPARDHDMSPVAGS